MKNLKADKACRLCGASNLNVCLELPHAPRDISHLLKADELVRDQPVDLRVYACESCGFVQLADFMSNDYYEEYLMTVSHSPQMRTFQLAQAKKFVSRFGLAGKRVLEAGCGDGNYLDSLQAAGATPIGLEPSRRFEELASAKGYRVHRGYLGANSPAPEGPYDGFVTRQVLEHIQDPHDFLQGIRISLREGACGLVEVPSLEQALEGSRFYDFFPDHVNYFSARTLRFVLERNGFEVIEITRGMNGEYNEAWVRLDGAPDFSAMQNSVGTLGQDLTAFLQSNLDEGKKVAVWGSGAKGLLTLAVTGVQGAAYVIDSDKNKQGFYTPVSHLKIVAPSHLRSEPVDAIVVTAMAYRDEIYAQLRGELHFTGPIAFLGARLEIKRD